MATTNEQWPAEVPVLSASDFCKHTLIDGAKACLVGHAVRCFGGHEREITKFIHQQVGGFVTDYNDAWYRPKFVLAWRWNHTMRQLGYEERDGLFVRGAK